MGQSIKSLIVSNAPLALDLNDSFDWEHLTETTEPVMPTGAVEGTPTLPTKGAEQDPTPAPVEPEGQPGSNQTPVDQVKPPSAPPYDEFDRALEQVSKIMREGRTARSWRPAEVVPADTNDAAGAVPGALALVGTAAVGAVGYRFVLRNPADDKRSSLWYARFPRT